MVPKRCVPFAFLGHLKNLSQAAAQSQVSTLPLEITLLISKWYYCFSLWQYSHFLLQEIQPDDSQNRLVPHRDL
jgi:hypothetical protein